MLNFTITAQGEISQNFLAIGITTFTDACNYIKHLPYGRNNNKYNLASLFTDKCGTCSTKHAVLKQLALENNCTDVQLMLVLFKMNTINTSLPIYLRHIIT
jgi:hypothetical protein